MDNQIRHGVQDALLDIKGLKTHFFTDDGVVKAVDGVDLSIRRGEVLGLVGESGCGKSVTALSIMGLIDLPGQVIDGSIRFDNVDLRSVPESDMVHVRGNRISMIFQQPQSFLNPIFKVGAQVAEVLRIHRDLDRQASRQLVDALLAAVGIPDAERRAHAYPHEFSGGMAQRVMIAMALACDPELLVADEPTTALDVTIQAQILNLIRTLRANTDTSVILITHDLGVIAELADRVAVMYAGRIVEEADVETLFSDPKHPYTQGLIRSTLVLGQVKGKLDVITGTVPNPIDLPLGCKFAPRCPSRVEHNLTVCTEDDPHLDTVGPNHKARCWLYHDSATHKAPVVPGRASGHSHSGMTIVPGPKTSSGLPVLEESRADADEASANGKPDLVKVERLVKYFPARGGLLRGIRTLVHAVEEISFTIGEGETLGLVGESGCGKTTVGRSILRMIPATHGSVWFDGHNVFKANKHVLKDLRRRMQYIFQNPFASLNPRMRVGDSIAEGLLIHGMKDAKQRQEIIIDTLRKVGLEDNCVHRYPHEFSGGQRQRIGIARALALRPKFIVCDEPVSALDVSVQSQVLNLLRDLQHDFGLTYLFIAHNLSVIEHISDRVAVMYLGKIVELADRDELFRNPLHPYTQALMSAIPIPDPSVKRDERIILKGDVPSPINPPTGCHFHTRCLFAMDQCTYEVPEYKEVSPGHWAACWLME